MDPITPHLWLDGTAEDAARFHVDTFPESRIGRITRYDPASAEVSGQPEGSVMAVSYELNGQPFVALNGGPAFRLTPAISFFVSSDTDRVVDRLFETLSEDGEILMPLQEYPFSEKYGWVNDRFGVSWQLNFAPGPMTIAPSLMFVGDRHGRAE
ncbi:MAG: VOC family protein, partial [Longimicrobiales bacterium]